jgi:hypothetical protein
MSRFLNTTLWLDPVMRRSSPRPPWQQLSTQPACAGRESPLQPCRNSTWHSNRWASNNQGIKHTAVLDTKQHQHVWGRMACSAHSCLGTRADTGSPRCTALQRLDDLTGAIARVSLQTSNSSNSGSCRCPDGSSSTSTSSNRSFSVLPVGSSWFTHAAGMAEGRGTQAMLLELQDLMQQSRADEVSSGGPACTLRT